MNLRGEQAEKTGKNLKITGKIALFRRMGWTAFTKLK